MRIVWYYELIRRKDNFIRVILMPVLILLVIFLVSLCVDVMFPVVNKLYMKWPDMVKNLLSLPSWSSKLYVNVWQLFAIIYPITMLYGMMTGLASSIVEEERLETVVYLHNLSVSRLQLILSKLLVWVFVFCCGLIALLLENTIFFLLVGAGNMIGMMAEHYISLCFVAVLYGVIAMFFASYHDNEKSCEDAIFLGAITTFLIARIYSIIEFLSALLVETGREGLVTQKMDAIVEKIRILTVVAPVTWCWPGISVRGVYIVSGVLITGMLVLAAGYIYQQRTFRDGV